MTQIDIIPPSLTSELEPARRLVVLVPYMESDYIHAVHRIWELANAQHASVLLLSLYKNTRQELSLRRSLITMCAMVHNGDVVAEMDVERGTNWVEVVKRHYRTGDLIVGFEEQRTGLLYKPLSQILQSTLKIP